MLNAKEENFKLRLNFKCFLPRVKANLSFIWRVIPAGENVQLL